MALMKVFHRTDAPLDGTESFSRHVGIHELVNGYEFVGRAKFGTSLDDFRDYHPAEAFNEAIRRWTYGPGASRRFKKAEVRPLVPGDIIIRADTGESVILTQDGYEVLDLKDVKGRTDLDSSGTPSEEKTFPGYDPGSNEPFDSEEHTYEEVEGGEREKSELQSLFE